MTDDANETTRRQVLRAGGATLATGGLSGLAGCFGTLPPLGSKINFGRVDTPAADDPTYRKWIPAPEAFETPDGDPTGRTDDSVRYAEPSEIERWFDGPIHPGDRWKSQIDYFGSSYESYEAIVGFDPATIIEAAFDRPSVATTLTDSGYERAGSYGGYDLFERSDPARVAAVSQTAIVWSDSGHPKPDVKTVIDARRGRVERRHAVDADFERVTAAVGASPWVEVGGDFGLTALAGARLGARGYRFTEDRVYSALHLVFSGDTEVSKDRLKRELRSRVDAETSLAADVSLDGQAATIELEQSYQAFTANQNEVTTPIENESVPTWPQVTWSADHDRDAKTVTVTHEAGDPVAARRLRLSIPSPTKGHKEEATSTQFDDTYDVVRPGDSVTVDVGTPERDDATLSLRYGIYGVGGARLLDYPLTDDG